MNPDITVVVPYHNERETIAYTLEQVGEQTLPAKVAIFVNSSSTDDTFYVVEDWIRSHQHRFHTRFLNIFENTDSPGSSKNVGIRHADTEWVAFMDCGQRFERNWLEKQFEYSLKSKVELVSGVVYLTGENWVDRCAAAQTYGYKRNYPCLPTTLVKKAVFGRTGLFLEGRRAGYDVAWRLKLKRMGIRRGINEDVVIRYIGFNCASNLGELFRKTSLYAKPTVAIEGYPFPYVFVIFPSLVLGALVISHELALSLIVLYLVTRSVVLPAVKSRNGLIFREHPLEAFLGLWLVGLVLDLGKLIGVLRGIKYYYFSRPGPP